MYWKEGKPLKKKFNNIYMASYERLLYYTSNYRKKSTSLNNLVFLQRLDFTTLKR